jgi:hypothetical protein
MTPPDVADSTLRVVGKPRVVAGRPLAPAATTMEETVPALPSVIGLDRRCTGLACPDCSGTLTVQIEGQSGYWHFRCRIGHGFSLASLLACKEEVLETSLWSAVTALAELAALLRDLDGVDGAWRDTCSPDAAHRRLSSLERAASALREALDSNVRIMLGDGDGEADAE